MSNTSVHTEEYVVSGDKLVAKMKELLHQGNIRRVTLKDDSGKTLVEVPLTLGVIGALLIPTWAALGAIAALVANLNIVVERLEPEAPASESSAGEAPVPEVMFDGVKPSDG